MSDFRITDAYNTVQLPVVLEQAFGVTRSQARRDLKGGGVRIDGEKYHDLTCARMDLDGKVLQLGKRRFARIEFA